MKRWHHWLSARDGGVQACWMCVCYMCVRRLLVCMLTCMLMVYLGPLFHCIGKGTRVWWVMPGVRLHGKEEALLPGGCHTLDVT